VPAVPPRADEAVREFARSLSSSLTAAAVLHRRGYREPEAVARFLEPKLAHLTPPDGMLGRSEAASRIARAIRRGERICIFGDYDADGITSTALLSEALVRLGADVVAVLADRFDGGYGLSDPALSRVLATRATLLVTCDCGSSDHARLFEAQRRGVDVVVIDHHRVPDEPLPALAFLNPHRPDCAFPYKGLASCGLALSVAAAVRAELGVTLDLRPLLDLVALGTIADVAPLDGDNRALVRAGLFMLAQAGRPGIRALAELAGSVDGHVTGEDVAYRFAPRINAPGRLGKPDLALELLRAREPGEARALAAEVDRVCTERRAIDKAMLAEANAMLEDPALAALPVIVLGKEGWHPGVVGIVAGRLASAWKKPTIVIGFDGATGRGSVRGPRGARLFDALALCRDTLIGFGGHQSAAGVHVESAKLDALRDAFAAACTQLAPEVADQGDAHADAVLEEGDVPERVLSELERFEPCGHENPAPLLALEAARVVSAREVRGGHLRLELALGGSRNAPLSAFGFELGSFARTLGARAHVFGRLRRDTYRGGGAIELRVESIEPA
jgi:single-stranded-DNA-specific exonuclease